jgi:hypothetical protein
MGAVGLWSAKRLSTATGHVLLQDLTPKFYSWLLWAMVRLGLKALLLRPLFVALLAAFLRVNPLQKVHPAMGLSLGVVDGGVK